MIPRRISSVTDRITMVELVGSGQSYRTAARAIGFDREWARLWYRRYRGGGEAALQNVRAPAPGAGATFSPEVLAALTAFRRDYPRLGARTAQVRLAEDPALSGQMLPSPSTIHRIWVAAGLVAPRAPREAPPAPPVLPVDPADPHAVWQIDHQDGIRVAGLATPLVLQDIRAPAAGLIVGAQLFASRGGAQAVPLDAVLDALRCSFATFGRPRAMTVDGGLHFLGRPQRSFPSRFELVCAGLDIAVVPIRPARPTDHGAVERQHATLDGILLGPPAETLATVQARLDAHVVALNTRFPSRARSCGGTPPLVAHPTAGHSGRPYDPTREWEQFDLAAVDRVLAGWQWVRKVSPNGQISFANRNIGIDRQLAGSYLQLRFDPADRHVVVYAPGRVPNRLGPELTRFVCAEFTKAAILGNSRIAPRPPGIAP